MDMPTRTELCVRAEIAGCITSVSQGRRYVDFTIAAGSVTRTFRVTKDFAREAKIKYPVHTLVLYETVTGIVVMVISNPSTSQVLQGVEWTEGGELPN
jgi:hypothetical protein